MEHFRFWVIITNRMCPIAEIKLEASKCLGGEREQNRRVEAAKQFRRRVEANKQFRKLAASQADRPCEKS
jgi:hypothetical protein